MPNATHLFVIEQDALGSTSREEIEATKIGLMEVGLYEMPYDRDVYVQISALEVVGPYANPHHSMIYGPIGVNQNVGIALHDSKLNHTVSPDPFNDDVAISEIKMVLIVLLATKNAVKRTKENKLAKLGIGKSPRHKFTYTTTISLPSRLEADGEHPPKGGHVAPHLRRGHVRRQHYGPGNREEKKIWIAPVFVNADPEFVATRTRYRIIGGGMKAA